MAAHVAIAELRKLGLRELLVSGERGYALTSAVGAHIDAEGGRS